ncbi:hypothetical protein RG959_20425 [Domibacillus sp. 8LH]|uniref:hypothetical protein n=1 Tax=Domibacillus sp. 8LH TaxID=3073900 RepID=UPI00316EF07A
MKEQIPEKVLESAPVKNSPIYQVSEGEVELPEEVFESDLVKNISDPDRWGWNIDEMIFDWMEMVR